MTYCYLRPKELLSKLINKVGIHKYHEKTISASVILVFLEIDTPLYTTANNN